MVWVKLAARRGASHQFGVVNWDCRGPAHFPVMRLAGDDKADLEVMKASGRNEDGPFCREVGMTEMTKEPVPLTDSDPHTGPEDRSYHPFFADPDDLTAETYPHLRNVSAGHMFKRLVRALKPAPPEYVTLPLERQGSFRDGHMVAIATWNLLWESAQFRRRYFDEDELPPEIGEIADQGDVNVVFVPRTTTRYYEYAPLYHLLSRSQAQRHGLPLVGTGIWPYIAGWCDPDRYLPAEFDVRLSRAWASAVWRHLSPGSATSAFSTSDPIRLLAHNLDFWIPPVTAVMEEILRGFPVVDEQSAEQPVSLVDGSILDGVIAASPRAGGTLWYGEDWAAEVVEEVVEAADTHGRLRAILDAVRSNRVEDDFSDRWSYARADFERKLYHKRNKVQVRFVELTDTIPVQSPETEVEGNLVVGDFLALLDERERQIVVLLRSGYTKLGEVASVLGYKNHSPVSKRLDRIRRKAAEHFSL
jgi:DNA-directed RNA polymerase specialized sigma24 family protein